jgi:hypothetical protein
MRYFHWMSLRAMGLMKVLKKLARPVSGVSLVTIVSLRHDMPNTYDRRAGRK